ncbi:hypothetical protein [Paenibacillus sp. SI8]|uniref:hypothetical protein n=1 Tax=unclassified Paenibacillus TaxID=185978 RepID=UPI003467DFFA
MVIHPTGYMNHPTLGKVAKEGIYLQGLEGYSKTKVYDQGLIGQPIVHKDGAYNILFLGDSFTEGMQVSDDKKYAFQVEQTWNASASSVNIHSTNFGRSSASPAYYIHLSEYYKDLVKPDLTVIQIDELDANDLLDSSQNIYMVPSQDNGSFQTIKNDEFASKNKIAQKFPQLYWLLNISVVRLGTEKLQSMIPKKKGMGETKVSAEDPQVLEALNWSVKRLKECYPNLVIVYIPKMNFNESLSNKGRFEQQLEESSKQYHVNLLNMRQPFIREYEKTHQPMYGFNNTAPGKGHINSEGHRLISESIVQFLKGELGE